MKGERGEIGPKEDSVYVYTYFNETTDEKGEITTLTLPYCGSSIKEIKLMTTAIEFPKKTSVVTISPDLPHSEEQVNPDPNPNLSEIKTNFSDDDTNTKGSSDLNSSEIEVNIAINSELFLKTAIEYSSSLQVKSLPVNTEHSQLPECFFVSVSFPKASLKCHGIILVQ